MENFMDIPSSTILYYPSTISSIYFFNIAETIIFPTKKNVFSYKKYKKRLNKKRFTFAKLSVMLRGQHFNTK